MKKLKHVGVSSVRMYNARRLAAMQQPEIICDHADPIAAIVPYQLYLQWQELVEAAARGEEERK